MLGNGGTDTLDVTGTPIDDSINYQPTSSAGGTFSLDGLNTLFVFDVGGAAANTFTIHGGGGAADQVVLSATDGPRPRLAAGRPTHSHGHRCQRCYSQTRDAGRRRASVDRFRPRRPRHFPGHSGRGQPVCARQSRQPADQGRRRRRRQQRLGDPIGRRRRAGRQPVCGGQSRRNRQHGHRAHLYGGGAMARRRLPQRSGGLAQCGRCRRTAEPADHGGGPLRGERVSGERGVYRLGIDGPDPTCLDFPECKRVSGCSQRQRLLPRGRPIDRHARFPSLFPAIRYRAAARGRQPEPRSAGQQRQRHCIGPPEHLER